MLTVTAQFIGEYGTGGAAADDQVIEGAILRDHLMLFRGIPKAGRRKDRAVSRNVRVGSEKVQIYVREALLQRAVSRRDIKIACGHYSVPRIIVSAGIKLKQHMLALRRS